MAQAYAQVLGGEWIDAKSAGIVAHARNPRTYTIMAAVGVDMLALQPTRLTSDLLNWADLLVSVSAEADEQCPDLPSHVQKKHWPLPDPEKTLGGEAEIDAAYRSVRDEIKKRVQGLIGGIRMISE